MQLSLISLVALAFSSFGAAQDIVGAITVIDESTITLGTTVSSWNGALLGALPIIKDSTALLIDIKKGKSEAEAAAPLDGAGTFAVAQATIALASNVNTTLEAVISAKPKFDKFLLGPVILANLKIEQLATAKFSEAVIDKVPEEFKGVAEILVGGIRDSFDLAIDVYGLF